MTRLNTALRALAFGMLTLAMPGALAQEAFPARPIRMLVTFSPGSQADILARLVGAKMFEDGGQQVIIDNRPSGGGVVGSQFVATAAPDGYTLLMASSGHAASASLYAKLPYDVRRDFAGVSQVSSGANVLIVPRSLGVKTQRDLVALAKSKPGELNFASGGTGSGGHINAEMFRIEAGIAVTHVAYKGAPEVLNDMMAGRIQFFFSSAAAALPFIRDGRMLALAVATRERSPLLPDVPTVAEAGLPGFEFDQWFALLAPAKTPAPVRNQISREVARVLALPDVKERMLRMGATPRSSTPDALDAFLASEIDKLGRVIRASGIRVE